MRLSLESSASFHFFAACALAPAWELNSTNSGGLNQTTGYCPSPKGPQFHGMHVVSTATPHISKLLQSIQDGVQPSIRRITLQPMPPIGSQHFQVPQGALVVDVCLILLCVSMSYSNRVIRRLWHIGKVQAWSSDICRNPEDSNWSKGG